MQIYRREEDSYALRALLSTIHPGPRRVCSAPTGRCRRGLRRRRSRSKFRPSGDHEVSRSPVFTTSAVFAAVSESRQTPDLPNRQHSPVSWAPAWSRAEKRGDPALGKSTATDDCRLAVWNRTDTPPNRERLVL